MITGISILLGLILILCGPAIITQIVKNTKPEKLTKVDVINMVVEKYSADTSLRSKGTYTMNDEMVENSCVYNGSEGRTCAFSMFVKEDYRKTLTEGTGARVYVDHDILEGNVKHITDKDFWSALQSLHDSNTNWDKNSLSKEGEHYVNHLLNNYKS